MYVTVLDKSQNSHKYHDGKQIRTALPADVSPTFTVLCNIRAKLLYK